VTRAFRRDLIYAGGLLSCLVVYGALPALPALRAAVALLSLVLVATHVIRSDEVARARSMQAGAAAFALAVAVSLAASVAGETALFARYAGWLWAWLFGAYLACWSVLRLVRG
jgi:hypothetical protein